MASRLVQYFADTLKSIKEYPITLTKAVYDENGDRLDNMLKSIVSSDTIIESEESEYKGVDPRDADTLGGKYRSSDIDDIKNNLNAIGTPVFLADGILNAWDEIPIEGNLNLSQYRYIYIELQNADYTCDDVKIIPIKLFASRNVSCPYRFYLAGEVRGYACSPDDINTKKIRLRSNSTTSRIRAYGII